MPDRFTNGEGRPMPLRIGDDEVEHVFVGLDALQADFWADIERRLKR